MGFSYVTKEGRSLMGSVFVRSTAADVTRHPPTTCMQPHVSHFLLGFSGVVNVSVEQVK